VEVIEAACRAVAAERPDVDFAGDAGGVEKARIGQAHVDFKNFQIQSGGQVHPLTLLEAMLLKLLVQNVGRVVTKGEILEKVWNVSADTQTRAVDNFIVRLRRYLEPNPRFPRHLLTVRGAGYRLLPDADGGTGDSSPEADA